MPHRKRRRRRRMSPLMQWVTLLLRALLCVGVIYLICLLFKSPPSLTVEAGSPLPLASAFLPKETGQISYLSDTSAIDTAVPGKYSVTLTRDGKKISARLLVQDTIAPTATAVNVTVPVSVPVNAEDFITDIRDATAVSVKFRQEPDVSTVGDRQVTIVLTDAGNNITTLNATLHVVRDTNAPQIIGVKNIITYAGDTVAYRNGITVSDDYDAAVKLEVDSSAVNLSTPGTYKVVYTATDAAGNTASQEATVEVLIKQANHVDIETIYARVDAILAQFITDDMTDRQKAEAVYVWTRRGNHLTYGSAPDRTDYLQTAYELLDTKKGDCFWFYAIQRLMLERLDIPTIDVKKVKNYPGDSNHYWLLVSVDRGQTYYHFDNVWSNELCLVTDKALNAFSSAYDNCFNRDESLYPATPTQDLPKSTLPWDNKAILNAKP